VVGSTLGGSYFDFAIVRYNSNGTTDASFDGDGLVRTAIGSTNDIASSIVLQPDGKLVVAGGTFNGSDYDFAVVRYNSNGSLDTSFNGTGKVTTAIGSGNDSVNNIILQPDGKLVVAGSSYNGSCDVFAIVRYNSNGTLDTSFNSTGIITTAIGNGNAWIRRMALQPDEKIVAAGPGINGSNYTFSLARYNGDGTLDNRADPPRILEIKPGYYLNNRNVTLDIYGWSFDDVIGLQLRNIDGSINATNLTILNNSHLTAQFCLPSSADLYDVYSDSIHLTHPPFAGAGRQAASGSAFLAGDFFFGNPSLNA